MNKLLVGNKCDLTSKKVVDYTTAKVRWSRDLNSFFLSLFNLSYSFVRNLRTIWAFRSWRRAPRTRRTLSKRLWRWRPKSRTECKQCRPRSQALAKTKSISKRLHRTSPADAASRMMILSHLITLLDFTVLFFFLLQIGT